MINITVCDKYNKRSPENPQRVFLKKGLSGYSSFAVRNVSSPCPSSIIWGSSSPERPYNQPEAVQLVSGTTMTRILVYSCFPVLHGAQLDLD